MFWVVFTSPSLKMSFPGCLLKSNGMKGAAAMIVLIAPALPPKKPEPSVVRLAAGRNGQHRGGCRETRKGNCRVVWAMDSLQHTSVEYLPVLLQPKVFPYDVVGRVHARGTPHPCTFDNASAAAPAAACPEAGTAAQQRNANGWAKRPGSTARGPVAPGPPRQAHSVCLTWCMCVCTWCVLNCTAAMLSAEQHTGNIDFRLDGLVQEVLLVIIIASQLPLSPRTRA